MVLVGVVCIELDVEVERVVSIGPGVVIEVGEVKVVTESLMYECIQLV
jgi:hypothetical protein